MSSWSIGDLLSGKYRLERKLGAGGAAEAWEAVNVLLERTVAVKILHAHLAKDSRTRSRFLAEARASARIAHPNVVDVFDIGVTDEGSPFIVMELCDGETLSTIIDGRGAVGVSYAADVMAQVLAALDAAHELGIVHRDLKPDNVMLLHPRPDQTLVKVLDFGIAQGIFGETGAPSDEGGFIFGTPEYMPPEQARGEPVDARADLYSAGVILYEILTGTPPFQGDTPSETLARMLGGSAEPPSLRVSGIPPELDRLVCQALAKAPSERPQTAREFLEALTPFTSSGHVPSNLPSRGSEAPVPLVAGRAPPASSSVSGGPTGAGANANAKKLELVLESAPPPGPAVHALRPRKT